MGRRAVRTAGVRALLVARRAEPLLSAASCRARQATFRSRVAVAARWQDAQVVLDLAPDCRLGAVEVEVYPYTRTVVRIGAGARLADGVRLSLRGGVLEVGEQADLRRLCTLHVGGSLRIGARSMLSTGVSVHCAESVGIGVDTLVSEFSTVVDSRHRRTAVGVPVQHAVATAPTTVGTNVWVGARVTITAGVSVGDQCVLGSGAVVTRDVPAGWLAVGVPARAVRELEPEC